MAIRSILEHPDPRLRTIAQPVAQFDAELLGQVQDLFDTLYASKGIGLAATQVDLHRRIVVVDVSGAANDPMLFINPVIVRRSTPAMVEESRLSLPGIQDVVRRDARITVDAMDAAGTPSQRQLEGLAAVCLQHEIDHLDGIMFADRLSLWSRFRLRWRLRKSVNFA
jgi:peptide deformylase